MLFLGRRRSLQPQTFEQSDDQQSFLEIPPTFCSRVRTHERQKRCASCSISVVRLVSEWGTFRIRGTNFIPLLKVGLRN